MVIHDALLVYAFQFVFALHTAQGHKKYLIIIVGSSLADETFPKFCLLIPSMYAQCFFRIIVYLFTDVFEHGRGVWNFYRLVALLSHDGWQFLIISLNLFILVFFLLVLVLLLIFQICRFMIFYFANYFVQEVSNKSIDRLLSKFTYIRI